MNSQHLYDNRQTLKCPHCGGEWLHHGAVEIWNRKDEDDNGEVVRVDEKGVASASAIDPAFVGRRDDIRVSFWCEGCSNKPTLVIWQHKGQTFQAWDYPK